MIAELLERDELQILCAKSVSMRESNNLHKDNDYGCL